MDRRNFWQHWPALILGLAVGVIFLAALMTFQVKETEYAIVLRFGRELTHNGAVKVFTPGLHMKIPFIDRVWKHDNRLKAYELKKGQVEQIQTADNYQVIVTTFVLWNVGDPLTFLQAVNTTEEAEANLDNLVRNSRNIMLGQHRLTELINTESSEVRLPEIEQRILEDLQPLALDKYGIHVEYLGFKHLGFPEKVSTKVFDRMKAERGRKSDKYRAEGKRDAQQIRARANLEASQILAEAESQAKQIRAEGDRDAASYYAAFQANPELAAFLRKLDALRKTLSEKTTLVLDTNTPPYDLLGGGALDLLKTKSVPVPGNGAQAQEN